jgi:ketosteroid isomerase-like protein
MKTLAASVLFACVCIGLASAGPREVSKGLSDDDFVKQQQQDLGDAIVAGDTNKLNQILADDWESVGSSGGIATKQSFLAGLKSGKHKLESFEIESMDVKVFGNVAAVHGLVTEKRTDDGKDTSGKLVWMDLLEKRGDKWVITRSAGARVNAVSSRSSRVWSPYRERWPG